MTAWMALFMNYYMDKISPEMLIFECIVFLYLLF